MTLPEAFTLRLRHYRPRRCKTWRATVEALTTDTTVRELMLAMPGFDCDMRRVVPIKCRERWLARQLVLAKRMVACS